ncbi:hypothetical protein EJ06DRAFT_115917 [Trichodelitschia bisporula]|uniref:Uncharacterized protein n=1 Tax=Trichodelitschia bisporula TaxID=703511 RepID=A0A6G1HQ10_9PEZI|nr:hypothetical protein EJ06DRAFT_115917 [Trichodelitschia bisporula]
MRHALQGLWLVFRASETTLAAVAIVLAAEVIPAAQRTSQSLRRHLVSVTISLPCTESGTQSSTIFSQAGNIQRPHFRNCTCSRLDGVHAMIRLILQYRRGHLLQVFQWLVLLTKTRRSKPLKDFQLVSASVLGNIRNELIIVGELSSRCCHPYCRATRNR